MALPPLTPEQRQAALDKAAASRRERAEVKNRLKHSGATLAEAARAVRAAGGVVVGAATVAATSRRLPPQGPAQTWVQRPAAEVAPEPSPEPSPELSRARG